MTLTAATLEGKPRFEALLRGGGKAIYDRPLLQRRGWLVAPTVGAAVPNWLLIIPRRPVLSFRDWTLLGGEAPAAILREVREHLGLHPHEVIWFEHGPYRAGTPVGCGLDHAHLHLLVRPNFTFAAFAERAYALANLNWRQCPGEVVFERLEMAKSYYVAGSGDQAMWAFDVEEAGSQFFRRVVASFASSPTEWDYREYRHHQNIAQTVETFKALESAARRAC